MKWINAYGVGIPVLDEQYKLLFERFVFVKDTVARGGDWNDTSMGLADLVKRFEFCAAVEEALMHIHDHPDGERHGKEHGELRRCLHALEKANLAGGLTADMVGAAFASAMEHHLTQDRRHARCLPGLGAHAQAA